MASSCRSESRLLRCAACLIASAVGLLLAGCVADGPQPPPRTQPRSIDIPSGLKVTTVVLAADQYPIDTDNNGFVDTFGVNVFLFPRRDEFPLPIHADGTFIFELLDRQENVIVRWNFDPELVAQARTSPLPGPSHQFRLSLLDHGSDQYPRTRTQLRSTFIPVDGEPILANGRPSVNIGPTTGR